MPTCCGGLSFVGNGGLDVKVASPLGLSDPGEPVSHPHVIMCASQTFSNTHATIAGGDSRHAPAGDAWLLHQHSTASNDIMHHATMAASAANILPPAFAAAALRASSSGGSLEGHAAALAAAGQWGMGSTGIPPQLCDTLAASFPSSHVASPYHASTPTAGSLKPGPSLHHLHLLSALGEAQSHSDALSPAGSSCGSGATSLFGSGASYGGPYEAALLSMGAVSSQGHPGGELQQQAQRWAQATQLQMARLPHERSTGGAAAGAPGPGAGGTGAGGPCFVAQVMELLSSGGPGLGPVLSELRELLASGCAGPGGAAAVDASVFVGLLQEASCAALAAAAAAEAGAGATAGPIMHGRRSSGGWGDAGGGGSGFLDGGQLAPVRTRAATEGGSGSTAGAPPPGSPLVQMRPQELAAARAALLRLMCAAHAMVGSEQFLRVCAAVGPVCELYDGGFLDGRISMGLGRHLAECA